MGNRILRVYLGDRVVWEVPILDERTRVPVCIWVNGLDLRYPIALDLGESVSLKFEEVE